MNEPKRRGRPPRLLTAEGIEDVREAVELPVVEAPEPAADDRAQAYALRVWGGQSISLGRGERVKRIKAALEGQGLSFDGVSLPGAE